MILSILFHGGATQTECHDEKKKAGHLQPELVHDVTHRAHSRARSAQNGIVCTAAADLVSGNPRHNARFSPGRDFAHASILAACGATMAQLSLAANRSGTRGI
jgi:hypothetical protein